MPNDKPTLDNACAFVQDQVNHNHLVQERAWSFCGMLMRAALTHDFTKFMPVEFEAFVDSRPSLQASTDGKDEAYQAALKSEGIQHHLQFNAHHPEHWNAKNLEMPPIQALLMYFDWSARCEQKGVKMEAFQEYNHAKLAKQPGALELVKYLARFEPKPS